MTNPDAKPADAVRMRLELSLADRERVRVRAFADRVDMSVWLRRAVLAELDRLDQSGNVSREADR